MNRLVRLTTGAVTVLVAGACAGNPQPGDSGYAYNVSDAYAAEFVVDNASYTGSMTLETAPGGVVAGTMNVTSPATITGTVTGMIAADTLSFESDYEIAENGCTGTVTGVGVVAEGGGAVSGSMEVYDNCADQGLEGSFDLTR